MVVPLPSQAFGPVQSISQTPSPHWFVQLAGHSPEPEGSTTQTFPPLSVAEPDEPVADSPSVVVEVGDAVVASP
jgi:hypothetical protein